MEFLVRAAAMMESEEAVVPQYNSMVPQYHQPVAAVRQHPYPHYQTHVPVAHPAVAGYSYFSRPMVDTTTLAQHHPSGQAVPAKSEDEATDDDMRVPVSRSNVRPGTSRGSSSNSAHNEVEKRRRAYLTQCYNQLHKILPQIAGAKASNATVLRSATDHIKALEREEKMLLAAKNRQLKIRQEILARRARARQSRQELLEGHTKPSPIDETVPVSSEDEGGALVPDNASRPVSPNLSPKEDLTQLASPIRKASDPEKFASVGGSGGPMRPGRRGSRVRVRNILIGE